MLVGCHLILKPGRDGILTSKHNSLNGPVERLLISLSDSARQFSKVLWSNFALAVDKTVSVLNWILQRAVSSMVEHLVYTEGVRSSSLLPRKALNQGFRVFSETLFITVSAM